MKAADIKEREKARDRKIEQKQRNDQASEDLLE